jgi:uncharacterized membrane protein YqgA involved in biofilm formation
MRGTILNVLTVALGSSLGLLVGARLSERIQESVVTGLGLVTFYVGISNADKTGNVIIPLLSVCIGVIIGELLRIDLKLENFAAWLQRRYAGGEVSTPTETETSPDEESRVVPLDSRQRFITGFVTASLVFCIGPLTFLGSLQDGMGSSSARAASRSPASRAAR